MPVTSTHPQYDDYIELWEKVENVLNGNAMHYIPNIQYYYPDGHPLYSTSKNFRAIDSCRQYRESGVLSNFTLQTIETIVGLATNAPPLAFELPPQLEYLKQESTGNKLSIDQLIQNIIFAQVSKGRCGLFTDFTMVDAAVEDDFTAEKQQQLRPKPHMTFFRAETTFNWDTKIVNGNEVLSLVVIYTPGRAIDTDDRFKHNYVDQYLVLELDDNNVYTQCVLDKFGKDVVATFAPRANGKLLDRIPFTFIGSRDNAPDCDPVPVKSLVELNIAHYKCSCAYMDNIRKYARGTLSVTAGLDPKKFAEHLKDNPITLGGDEGIFLGPSGELKIAQLQPAQEAAIAMERLENQMIKLGAHIVIEAPANITENTTRLNMGGRISTINTIVGNCEDGIREHLNYCADYAGANKDLIDFQMSREFITKLADPAVMQQVLAQFTAGVIPASVVLDYDKSVKLLPDDVDYGELQNEIDLTSPLGNDMPTGLDTPTFTLPGTPVTEEL